MSADAQDKRERLAAIGEITAEVVHELRNGLQIISANVFLAKQDPANSAPNLAKIERSARQAHAIVDDLLALARGEPAHAEPIQISSILLAAREDLVEIPTFVDHIDPPHLLVRAHPRLLSRCMHALYENAAGASAPRLPTIVTRAWTELERVILEVSDDGPGVPKAIEDSLFEPLVTARAGGTGLGLSFARRVILAHGGTIALVKRSEGHGATFRVDLER